MLISTTAELMKYVEVSRDLNILSVTPSIKKAERRFILPILGAFYNEVQEMYEGNTATDKQKELIKLINLATAPLAMWYYVQVGGVSIDNSGIYKPKNPERWNLGDSEQTELKKVLLYSGLDALDDLLVFLNNNLVTFTTYASSQEREDYFKTLVPTARVVQKVFTMLHPQVTYRALREAIRYVENRVERLMQEFYFYLIDTPVDDLSMSHKSMLDKAQRAIIYFAASRAMITRTVVLTNEGLEVMMGDRTQISEPENARIEAASKEYLQSGEVELSDLLELLNANPPTGYVPPVVPSITERCKNPVNSKIAFL